MKRFGLTHEERERAGAEQAEAELTRWATEGQLRDLEEAKRLARVEHGLEPPLVADLARDEELLREREDELRRRELDHDLEWRSKI